MKETSIVDLFDDFTLTAQLATWELGLSTEHRFKGKDKLPGRPPFRIGDKVAPRPDRVGYGISSQFLKQHPILTVAELQYAPRTNNPTWWVYFEETGNNIGYAPRCFTFNDPVKQQVEIPDKIELSQAVKPAGPPVMLAGKEVINLRGIDLVNSDTIRYENPGVKFGFKIANVNGFLKIAPITNNIPIEPGVALEHTFIKRKIKDQLYEANKDSYIWQDLYLPDNKGRWGEYFSDLGHMDALLKFRDWPRGTHPVEVAMQQIAADSNSKYTFRLLPYDKQ